MRSNCHVQAWRAYRRGEAKELIFRPSRYSRLRPVVGHWAWSPLRGIGICCQWAGQYLMQFGSTMRDGSWWHAQWRDQSGKRWEFHKLRRGVPDTTTQHWLPPLLFHGVIREVRDE